MSDDVTELPERAAKVNGLAGAVRMLAPRWPAILVAVVLFAKRGLIGLVDARREGSRDGH